jgi:hypothetical protein
MLLKQDEFSKEIVAGRTSGGANTSHTIVMPALAALLAAVPHGAPASEYQRAAIEGNALGKATEGGRRRTFRYVRELYLLSPQSILFRALRDLWNDDLEAQPLLAGLCALARDSVFWASSIAITSSSPGDELTSEHLAGAVGERFPDSYSAATLAKIGRNTFSSWQQTGHLGPGDQNRKRRTRAAARPANLAYMLMLGYLKGVRGGALFDTLWAKVLDAPKSHLLDLAFGAAQRGLIEFRQAGGVIDVGFNELLRPFEGELL